MLNETTMKEALNILRNARKESSQAMVKASYSSTVQNVFDALEAEAKPKFKPKTLDDIAAEQAAYYGMTPEKHGEFMNDCAEAQEIIEREGE